MSLLTEVISKDQDLVGSGKYLHGAVNNSLVVDTEKDIYNISFTTLWTFVN